MVPYVDGVAETCRVGAACGVWHDWTTMSRHQPHRPLRVLMMGPPIHPPSGGMAVAAATIRDEANRTDLGVVVRSCHSGGGSGRAGYRAFPAALRSAASSPYDVLHLHVASGGSTLRKASLAALARARRRPYTIHLHGGGYRTFLARLSPLALSRVRSFYRHAAAVVVLGEGWVEVVERLGVARHRIHVIANGVAPVATRAHDPKAPPTILFVGGLTRAKGVDTLLDAAHDLLLRPQFAEWRLRLLGRHSAELAAQVAKAAAATQGRVQADGVVLGTAKTEAFADADIFVLPSRAEALPLSLLEAMSAGLPAVCSDVGSVSQVLVPGRTGALVAPGDVAGLVTALEGLMADAGERTAQGAAARARWEAHYRADVMLEQLATMWKQVADA